MPTSVQKFVVTGGTNGDGTAGNPWSTLDNAMTGLATLYPSGLPTADVQVDLFCSGSTQDTAPNTATGVNVSIVTDATRYLRILAAAGQNATMPYSTSRYRLVQTNGFRPCLTVATTYLYLIGLQFRNTGLRANNAQCLAIPSTAGRVTVVDGCYCDFTGTDAPGVDCVGIYLKSTGTNHQLTVRNTVTTGGALGIRRSGSAAGAVTMLDNNTCVSNTGNGIIVDVTAGGTHRLRNNLCSGNGIADYNLTGTLTATAGNRSGDATSPDVAGRSQTFTFVNAAGGDWHLAAGDVGAKGQGTNLTADANDPFSNDLDGDTRPSSGAWDSGADQTTGGGGGGGGGTTYYYRRRRR